MYEQRWLLTTRNHERMFTDTCNVSFCFQCVIIGQKHLLKGNDFAPFWSPAGGSASTGLFLHWVGWQERQEAVFRGLEPYIGNSFVVGFLALLQCPTFSHFLVDLSFFFNSDTTGINGPYFQQYPPLSWFLRMPKKVAKTIHSKNARRHSSESNRQLPLKMILRKTTNQQLDVVLEKTNLARLFYK
jgi:hypothetical protein